MTEDNKMPDVIYLESNESACFYEGRQWCTEDGNWMDKYGNNAPGVKYILPTHPVLEGMAEALRAVHKAYERDIEAAIEIMDQLGRHCDRADVMVQQMEKTTGYTEALAAFENMKKGNG